MKILVALSVVAFMLATATPAFSTITADAGGPYTFYLGDVLTLDASGSTPSTCVAPNALYYWDFDYDGTYDEIFLFGQAVVDLYPVDYASFFPIRLVGSKMTLTRRLLQPLPVMVSLPRCPNLLPCSFLALV